MLLELTTKALTLNTKKKSPSHHFNSFTLQVVCFNKTLVPSLWQEIVIFAFKLQISAEVFFFLPLTNVKMRACQCMVLGKVPFLSPFFFGDLMLMIQSC